MQIELTLKGKNTPGLSVPIHYNTMIQGFIYHNIQSQLAEFLHNQGFTYEKRVFKLFTFSKLQGKYILDQQRGRILFNEPPHLLITTVFEALSSGLINGFLLGERFQLGNQPVEVLDVKVFETPLPKGPCVVVTKSPIAVYSTEDKPDGRSFTHFFKPGDFNYNHLITNNLIKKHQAFYGVPMEGEVKVKPLNRMVMRKVFYKNTPTQAYEGRLLLSGTPELLRMGLAAGLGSRNSQGLGCIQMEKECDTK